MSSDLQLLQDYVSSGSESSFRQIVDRHVHLVYSAAHRQLGDDPLVEDVVQNVFILLARQASSIHTNLPGWLFHATRNLVHEAIRSRHRRQARDHAFHQMTPETQDPSTDSAAVWQQIGPLLNDAIAGLEDADREAVSLHFLSGKSHREVGEVLGIQEDTARKRVSRAVERLRQFFASQGFDLSTGSIVAACESRALQIAPAVLVESAIHAAMSAAAAGSVGTGLVVKSAGISGWAKAGLAMCLAGSFGTTAWMVLGIGSSGAKRIRPDLLRLADGKYLQLQTNVFSNSFSWKSKPLDAPRSLRSRWMGPKRMGDGSYSMSRFAPSWSFSMAYGWSGHNDNQSDQSVPGVLRLINEKGDSTFLEQIASMGSGEDWNIGYSSSLFPRRGSRITLQVLQPRIPGDFSSWHVAGEFDLNNPAPSDAPPWTPEPVPQRRIVDGLAVSLTRFAVDRVSPPERESLGATTQFEFALNDLSVPNRRWEAKSVTLSDATGNIGILSRVPSMTPVLPEGKDALHYPVLLWESEPAWKIQAEFIPTSHFLASDLVSLIEIPIPEANEVFVDAVRDAKTEKELPVIRVSPEEVISPAELLQIAGTSSSLPEPNRWVEGKGKIKLFFEPRRSKGKRVVIAEIVDSNGRQVPYDIRDISDHRIVQMDRPVHARHFTIRLAEVRVTTVDFLAHPEFTGKLPVE